MLLYTNIIVNYLLKNKWLVFCVVISVTNSTLVFLMSAILFAINGRNLGSFLFSSHGVWQR